MQHYDLWNYEIQITEKIDFDTKLEKYPDLEPFFCCRQMHSNLVHEWDPDWQNTMQWDGIYTDQKWIWLKVGVSDCNPVAIMGKRRFGIVHAGRRWIQHGIIQNMFHQLQEKGESDFSVFVWPSIRKCCYEVGEEFCERCDPQFMIPQSNGKFHLDMMGMINNILKNFPCEQLNIHPECTKCGSHFFSYRKQDGINNFMLIRRK